MGKSSDKKGLRAEARRRRLGIKKLSLSKSKGPDLTEPATKPIEPVATNPTQPPLKVGVPLRARNTSRVPDPKPRNIPNRYYKTDLANASQSHDLFRPITGPQDLDGIALNTHLFAKRHPSDTQFDTLVYHGSNRYLNITTGESYDLRHLLRDFKDGGIGIVNKAAVDKVKETTIRKRADIKQRRLTLDIETAMEGDHKSTLEKAYSLGIARHYDNTKFSHRNGKTVAAFRHKRHGKTLMADAAGVYNDTLTHISKDKHVLGEASDLAQLESAIDAKHKLGILSNSDVSYLRQDLIKGSYSEQVKHEVLKFVKMKEHFLKGQVAGHLRYSGRSAGKPIYSSVGLGESAGFSHEFYDSTEFKNFTESYLSGDLKVQSRLYGEEGLKHIRKYGGLDFLKEHIGKGNVTLDDAKNIAMEFYQGEFRKPEQFSGKADVQEAYKKVADQIKHGQLRSGTNMLIDLRGNKNMDLQHLHAMLSDHAHEVFGNHGSTTETDFMTGAEAKILQNNHNVKPQYFGRATLRKPIRDSMGSMIDGLAQLTAAHKHTGLVDHEGIRSAFYEMYGNNANFSKLTGIPSSEIHELLNKTVDSVYNKFGGNKTVQNWMHIQGILAKEPHRAGGDAAYEARAASAMANDLDELNWLKSKPLLTQHDEYRMRELGMKYAHGIITQQVLDRSNKAEWHDQPQQREKAQRKLVRDLARSYKERNGLSPERETKLKERARVQIEREMRSKYKNPKHSGFFLESATGAANWKEFIGGALLNTGMEQAAHHLTGLFLNQHNTAPANDDDKTQRKISGFSHNGIQKVIDRLNNSDFGSGRKPGNPSTIRSMWRAFGSALDDTDMQKGIKRTLSNINSRFRKSAPLAKRFRAAQKGFFRDLGTTVSSSFPNAGAKIQSWSKKGSVLDLLEKTFVKPVVDIKTNKTPLSKLVPSMLKTPVGKVALVAGAITGIGLWLMSGRSAQDHVARVREKADAYAKKNRIKGTNPWPGSNANKLAEIMTGRQAGIEHGGLQRQLNRGEMTDFRSPVDVTGRVIKGILAAAQDARGMVKAAKSMDIATEIAAKGKPTINAAADIEAAVAKVDTAIVSKRNPANAIPQLGSRVEAAATQYKPHKYDPSRSHLGGYEQLSEPGLAALDRSERISKASRNINALRFNRGQGRILQPGSYEIEGLSGKGPQAGANLEAHLNMLRPKTRPIVQRTKMLPPAVDRSTLAKLDDKAWYAVGKARPVPKAMAVKIEQATSLANAAEATRTIANAPVRTTTPKVIQRPPQQARTYKQHELKFRSNFESMRMLEVNHGTGFGNA